MNEHAVLALIGDLYAQLQAAETHLQQERETSAALVQRIETLEAERPTE